jgi:hypothetical protein
MLPWCWIRTYQNRQTFHVEQSLAKPQFARFTWNTQSTNHFQSTQSAKSFHVKRVGQPAEADLTRMMGAARLAAPTPAD